MDLKKIILSDYFKLFVKREGRVVLGRHYASLWLLCGVLIVTFLAIAFSTASLNYLKIKMKDPFIQWVDIRNNFADNRFPEFVKELDSFELQEQYHYNGFQTDKYWYYNFFTENDDCIGLRGRYFGEISTPLVEAILNEENVVDHLRVESQDLHNNSYGVIITQEALVKKLGYTEKIPSYIHYHAAVSDGANEWYGVPMYGQYAKVPIPVLAVVNRLPSNLDLIGTKHFYHQVKSQSFDMCNPYYFNSFYYHLPESINEVNFKSDLKQYLLEYYPDYEDNMDYAMAEKEEMPKVQMAGIGGSQFVSLIFFDEDAVDFDKNRMINEKILEKYAAKGVERIYIYDENSYIEDEDDFLSIYFYDLQKVTDFQRYAKEKFSIEIEMSQINAKENFYEVTIMANILSWTMIFFAIVCIMLFIINLLQSYFQKVKHNLGTFKAFGMGNTELIAIYILIMIATIVSAIFLSLLFTWFVQEFLSGVGILKDGTYDYFCLWSWKTLWSIIIILLTSVGTVFGVMERLLRATPGDLIYDR